MTVTSLQLHCCPLLLNLNGFDLALQTVLVCFSLPGERGRTFVRCQACSIHKQFHGKKGSQTEDGGSGGGSSAAGGGGGGSPAARRQVEAAEAGPAAGVDGGGDRQQAWMEAATAEARQQAWAAQQAWVEAAAARQRAEEAVAASRQQAEAAVAAATAEQQRIPEHTRARAELTAKVIRLLIEDHGIDIRRLSARIHP